MTKTSNTDTNPRRDFIATVPGLAYALKRGIVLILDYPASHAGGLVYEEEPPFFRLNDKIKIYTSDSEVVRVSEEHLRYADRLMTSSGLLKDMAGFYVLPGDDPVFSIPYHALTRNKGIQNIPARTYYSHEGLCVVVKNQPLTDDIVPHELGHCAHPSLNPRMGSSVDRIALADYYRDYYGRFTEYFRVPVGGFDSELYISFSEWIMAMYNATAVGETFWPQFLLLIPENVRREMQGEYGANDNYIPDTALPHLIGSLHDVKQGCLVAQALEWRLAALKNPRFTRMNNINGFTNISLGSYLLLGALISAKDYRRLVPDSSDRITVDGMAATAFHTTEQEMFADTFFNPEAVAQLEHSSPKIVTLIREVERSLKS